MFHLPGTCLFLQSAYYHLRTYFIAGLSYLFLARIFLVVRSLLPVPIAITLLITLLSAGLPNIFNARLFSRSIYFSPVRLSFSLIRIILLAAYYCRPASSFRHVNPSGQFIFIGLFLSPERNILAGRLLFPVLRLFFFCLAYHFLYYIFLSSPVSPFQLIPL